MSEGTVLAGGELSLHGLDELLNDLTETFHSRHDFEESWPSDGVTTSPVASSISSPSNEQRDSRVVDFAGHLSAMKRVLLADAERHSDETFQATVDLSVRLQATQFFLVVFRFLQFFPLDVRKDVVFVTTSLLRRNAGDVVAFFQQHTEVIDSLLSAMVRPETALLAGQVLREAAKQPFLAYVVFLSSHFWHFFEHYLHSPNFDVASESFALIKELLTAPQLREVQDGFFETNGDVFILQYQLLLGSENLLTRRRALKLLSELLLDRHNYGLMVRFIASRDNLKTIMNLLRHRSSQITFEAFHVFKIFVANPKKTKEVAVILYNNRAKLVPFLQQFHADKTDALFVEEKALLVDTLAAMDDPDPGRTAAASAYSPSNLIGLPSGGGGSSSGGGDEAMSFSPSVSASTSPRASFSSSPRTSSTAPSAAVAALLGGHAAPATPAAAAGSSSSALLRKHLRPRASSHAAAQRTPLSRTTSPLSTALAAATVASPEAPPGPHGHHAHASLPGDRSAPATDADGAEALRSLSVSGAEPHAPPSSAAKHLHHQQSHQRLLSQRQQHHQQLYEAAPSSGSSDASQTSQASQSSRLSGLMPLTDSFRSAMHLDRLSLGSSDSDAQAAAGASQAPSGEDLLASSFPTPLPLPLPPSPSLERRPPSPTPSPAYYLHYNGRQPPPPVALHAQQAPDAAPRWSPSAAAPSPAKPPS